MVGSAMEICASHVDWLLGEQGAEASAALRRIVDGSKLLSFKLARRRPFDAGPILDEAARAWQEAMDALESAV
jgi:hypothetical protein